jgi:serine/threonine-protein kinase HipA
MAVNGKTAEIARADVLEVGDRFGVPSMLDVVDQVLEAVTKWPTFADEAAVPEVTANKVNLVIKSWAANLR